MVAPTGKNGMVRAAGCAFILKNRSGPRRLFLILMASGWSIPIYPTTAMPEGGRRRKL